jgi:hypothetical protein
MGRAAGGAARRMNWALSAGSVDRNRPPKSRNDSTLKHWTPQQIGDISHVHLAYHRLLERTGPSAR